MVRRIKRRITDNNDPSDVTVDVLNSQLSYQLGDMTWDKVDASSAEYDTLRYKKQILG